MRIVALALALATVSLADVLVVDGTGEGDFTTLQAAVDAAQDGDTILVRPLFGSDSIGYAGFEVVDRDLRIIGEAGATVYVDWIEVRDLAPTRGVSIAHLIVGRDYDDGEVRLKSCEGPVRLADVRAWQARLTVNSCDDVVASQCFFYEYNSPGIGMVVEDSRIALYGTKISGGLSNFCDGAPGVVAKSSWIWASGSALAGGSGSVECSGCCGDGGVGARLEQGTELFLEETTLSGGGSGVGSLFTYPVCGDPAPPYILKGGSTIRELQTSAIVLDIDTSLQEERAFTIKVGGWRGDQVFLHRSLSTVFDVLPDAKGIVHVPDVLLGNGLLLGTIPADGVLTTEVVLPPLPGGDVLQYVQVRTEGLGGNRIGHPSVITMYGTKYGNACIRRVYVDADVTGQQDGLSWQTAYSDLGKALHEARKFISNNCDDGRAEVWVAEGVYPSNNIMAAQLGASPGASLRVFYSCIQGLTSWPNDGNTGQDPLMVDPFGPDGVAGTDDDDLRLGPGSPAVDAGSNYLLPADDGDLDGDGNRLEPLPLDLGGERRKLDDPAVTDSGAGTSPVVDMGAHERVGG
jgi:hypothetical protein